MANGTNGNGNGFGKSFKGGAAAGITGAGIYIFNQPSWVSDPHAIKAIVFAIDYIMKLSLVAVSGAFFGLVGNIANDWYQHRKQNRIFKNKKKDNDKMERDEQERVA